MRVAQIGVCYIHLYSLGFFCYTYLVFCDVLFLYAVCIIALRVRIKVMTNSSQFAP